MTAASSVRLPDDRRRRLRITWVFSILLVIAGSLAPATSGPMEVVSRLPVSDKVLHFTGYGILAILPALHEPWRTLWRVSVGVVLLGVLLEFGQRYSPGRTFEVADMLANLAGVLCGLAIGRAIRPERCRDR